MKFKKVCCTKIRMTRTINLSNTTYNCLSKAKQLAVVLAHLKNERLLPFALHYVIKSQLMLRSILIAFRLFHSNTYGSTLCRLASVESSLGWLVGNKLCIKVLIKSILKPLVIPAILFFPGTFYTATLYQPNARSIL